MKTEVNFRRPCQLIKVIAAVTTTFSLISCATSPSGTADTIYVNGKIVTADNAFSIAQAVAVKNGKFIRTGTNTEIQQLAAPGTRTIDLKGRTVIPGLIDSHDHMSWVGTADTTAQVSSAKSVADAQTIIGNFIKSKNVQPGVWVQTSAWHPPSQLQEHRYLTRQEIDAVAPNNPVYAQTVGHFAMANSKALELAGITRTTKDPAGGKINRDANGDATGVLEETAIDLVTQKIPKPTPEELVAQTIAAQHIYSRSGITGAIDAALNEDGIQAYYTVAERGQSTVRAGLMWLNGGATAAEFEKSLRSARFKDNTGNDWVHTAGIKMFSDGGMSLKTAYIRDVYADDPHNHGSLSLDPVEYAKSVRLADQYGWRVGTHAVGDAAVDVVLNAYEEADKVSSIRNKRFILIHGSLITQDQINRAKRLGVRVDAQNVFLWDKAATVEKFMGKPLANRAVPTRSLLDTLGYEGTAAGTDNPVNLLNPFVGMYVMVTRKDPRGVVYGADQAVSREQALRLYTNAGAYYTFEEKKKGSIEPGKFADMVVLSADYLTVPEAAIKDIKPVQTIVADKVVYDAGN